jgi:molybdopterin synthase catalytic subunit
MIKIQEQDFDVGAELSALRSQDDEIGAIVSFTGLVRGDGGAIRSMTLEHYPAMTNKRLNELETAAMEKWPLQRVLIIHRFGELSPGDQIVLVATTSSHRQAAFDACNYLIDWLKTEAPFWKLEETNDGNYWVAARADDTKAASRWE